MIFSTFLDKTGTLKRQSVTQDAIGSPQGSVGTASAPFKCSLQYANRIAHRDGQPFARDDRKSYFRLYTQTDLGATQDDVIVINGVNYHVEESGTEGNTKLGIGTLCTTLLSRRNSG